MTRQRTWIHENESAEGSIIRALCTSLANGEPANRFNNLFGGHAGWRKMKSGAIGRFESK